MFNKGGRSGEATDRVRSRADEVADRSKGRQD